MGTGLVKCLGLRAPEDQPPENLLHGIGVVIEFCDRIDFPYAKHGNLKIIWLH